MQLPPTSQLQASAIRFLIDGHDEDAALVLLSCSLNVEVETLEDSFMIPYDAVTFTLTGPRVAFDVLDDGNHAVTVSVKRALEAVLPQRMPVRDFVARAQLIVVDADWRDELLAIARGRGVNNQVPEAGPQIQVTTWANLRFRSQSEVHVAQALERAGVLFLPNCKARLGVPQDRKNREADFLVCVGGKWGILEVDGEPFHPPSRTAQDHERDRLFRDHGILVVEHFDATECYQNPDSVVSRFLGILRRA